MQSLQAAIDAGKTIAEVLGDVIDKLVKAGKL
ncbi:microcompartment protein CcmL/EutN [Rhizobium sp. BK313]|nr:microcompartment protein CcmL/EutN [Rhizobium sp. BK313]